MRKATFFIPHYEDHERLIFMISMLDQMSEFPSKYIIYDSSPEPIGKNRLSQLECYEEIVYKEFKYHESGNTYPLVLRDFCLSEDSDDGAFILPNDEMIILDHDDFSLVDRSTPFACSSQFSFCPETRKVAEYSRSIKKGCTVSKSQKEGSFLPQYHGTFMPKIMLKGLGQFMKNFIDKWGNFNAFYIDFIIIDLLEQLDTFYSPSSIYIQEKLAKRKASGTYNHPAKFISSINKKSREQLGEYILELWDSVEILSPRYFKSSLKYLLNPEQLRLSLYMINLNKSDFLFKLIECEEPKFGIERMDTFTGYHIVGSSLTKEDITYIYRETSKLGSRNILKCLRDILNSYK